MLLVGNMLPLEEAATGRGSSKFVPHSMLPANLGKNTEFICDDCLCFKISKVDVKHITSSLSVSGLHRIVPVVLLVV